MTAEAELAVVRLTGADPDEVLEFLDARAVKGRLLSLEGFGDAALTGVLLVPLQDVHGLDALERELATRFEGRAALLRDLGTVTCVGTGLLADHALVRRALETAAELSAHVHAVSASSLQLSLLVDRAHLPELTRRLHRAFLPPGT